MEDLSENGICEEQVRCACHSLQLSIKNHIDPPKPKNGSTPTNATSELIGIFRKLVNKIHGSTLLTENLRSVQSGGPITNLLVEIEQDDDACGEHLVNEIEIAASDPAAARVSALHTTPRGHTLKLIKDAVTRWNLTYYMLARCVLLAVPLHKLIEELGLEGLPMMTGQLLSCCATSWSHLKLSLIIFKVKNTPHLAVCPESYLVFEQAKTTTIMG